MARKNQPEPIAVILPGALRSKGLEHLLPEAELRRRWKDVVGGKVAGFAEMDSLRNFVLGVRVADAVWRNELHYQREAIRRRANEVLGSDVVKEVRLR